MARKPYWMKVYPYAILASARCRRLPYEELGLWFAVMIAAFCSTGRAGELRVGERPWTLTDLCDHLDIDRRRRAKLERRLAVLFERGLLDRKPDGAIFVPRFEELQGDETSRRRNTEDIASAIARRARPPRPSTIDYFHRR